MVEVIKIMNTAKERKEKITTKKAFCRILATAFEAQNDGIVRNVRTFQKLLKGIQWDSELLCEEKELWENYDKIIYKGARDDDRMQKERFERREKERKERKKERFERREKERKERKKERFERR
eukprot:144046_1